MQGAGVGLFYYAGHGLGLRGTNYLVPVSANPTREADLDFQMVDVEVALHQMEAAGTKLNVVMLDACRNNPFGGRGLRAGSGGLTQMQAPEGTLISYATQPNSVAQDGTDGNSPYSKALAETIGTPGLDILQSFNRVGVVVKQATGGVPGSPGSRSHRSRASSTSPDGNEEKRPPRQSLRSEVDGASRVRRAMTRASTLPLPLRCLRRRILRRGPPMA